MFKLNQHSSIPSSVMALSLVSLIVMMGFTMVIPSLTPYTKLGLGANEFIGGAVIAGFAMGQYLTFQLDFLQTCLKSRKQ